MLAVSGASSRAADSNEGSVVSKWWNGKNFTGNWFGVRDDLAERGIDIRGKWVGIYYGVIESERGSRGFFDQELAFDAEADASKLVGNKALEGLTAAVGGRWRDPRGSSNPNTFIEGNPMFNPARYQSGTQWRLTHFFLSYSTPEVFGIKNFLTLKGGWVQPQKDFLVQPLSLLFVNNTICSAKGLTTNMPWSSSLSTWGGTAQIKPIESVYLKGGLYMACPQLTATGNHGLAFEGYAPDPSRNGLMTMVETGWTPEIFGLGGKYAAGAYYHGVDAVPFNGESIVAGVYGFYFQADQMLYREPTPEDADTSSSGKSFKSPVAPAKKNDQGLSMFNLLTFAPAYVNLVTFYFQSGLVYKGLIPGRDEDLTMCAIAYANYSVDKIHVQEESGITNQADFTAVLEADYRIQVNRWAFIQPYAQYLIRPNGTDAVSNAAVLGFMAGLTF